MPDTGPTRAFLVFFFLSGACSLVYQVVWLRLAMARFGVTAPLVSIVISVFMAGLAIGSLVGGRVGDYYVFQYISGNCVLTPERL